MIKTVIVAFTLVFGFVSCSPAPQLRKVKTQNSKVTLIVLLILFRLNQIVRVYSLRVYQV